MSECTVCHDKDASITICADCFDELVDQRKPKHIKGLLTILENQRAMMIAAQGPYLEDTVEYEWLANCIADTDSAIDGIRGQG